LIYKPIKNITMDLEPYYQMVESCIKKLGVDPLACRGQNPGQWDLKRGSASVWIDVFKRENDYYGYFQCMAPVAAVPTNNVKEFYEEVLEKNYGLYGAAMNKFKDWVYMKTIRELDGIDEDEMMNMLSRVGTYADDLDDYFRNKYSGADSPKSV
jgi:hypothetical protein